jgi:signal transduction histidine kinase
VTGALFAPLLLLVVVAAMSWRSEKRYAVVTDRVIHDYAAIAAWQFARRATAALHNEAMQAFEAIASAHEHQRTAANQRPADPAVLLQGDRTGSTFLANARFAFTFDAGDQRLTTAGGAVDSATRAMLLRRLRRPARTTGSDDPHRVIFDTSAGSAHAIALWTIAKQDDPARVVYGVVADPVALRHRFLSLLGEHNLVLGTSSATSFTEDDIAIRLTRPDGGLVFATRRGIGRTAATDSAGLQSGELRTTVDLAPQVANVLLVGGAPRSQLPALALMIVVAAVLAIVALRHQRRLRELQLVRERFVANVSHELRTPLAQISMFAETLTLGRERSPAERTHFASIIFAEARRLTALVENVLRFSRADTKRTASALQPANVGAEIADAVEAFTPIAVQADVTITLTPATDAFALVDRDGLRQILLNLLDNAVKHGGRGTVIDVSTHVRSGEIHIVVDDDGPGIPQEWRARVFQPFARVERAHVAGAGIGLAVVHDLVAAHGGRVWIEDSPRMGARFTVALLAVSPESRTSGASVAPDVHASTGA